MMCWIRKRALLGGMMLLSCWFLGGCNARSRSSAGAEGRLTGREVLQVHLMAMPLGVNLDQTPGCDGFQVKVYAVSEGQPKPTPIPDGELEILMYDGVLAGKAEGEALRVWTFPAADLRPYTMRNLVGTGYAFTLKWEAAVPKHQKITVLARYSSPEGKKIVSAPSSITVAD